MPQRKWEPTPGGVVLRSFRWSFKLSEKDFAQRAGVSREHLSRWERGEVRIERNRLVEVLSRFEIPPEAVDAALSAYERRPPRTPSFPTDPPEEELAQIQGAASAAGARTTETVRAHLLSKSRRQEARRHRAWAEELWSRLRKLPAKKQETMVEALLGDPKSWALAVTICQASASAAAHRASDALLLARLGIRLAEHSPGPEAWRLSLRGWCGHFLANALRVAGQLAAAEEAFARAEDLWSRGAGGDPDRLLDGARLLDLRASLLMYKGQFEEARHLLDVALGGTADGSARGRLLIMKAVNLGVAGAYETSLEVLRQAEPLVDPDGERRPLFLHRFNTASNLCHLDCYADAEPLVALAETLAAELGNELDQVRTHWLRGKTWAGTGRREEGLAALSRVRQYFLSKEIPYDFALVTLEVAVLHLERGRTQLVQELAREMLWIFESQRVHPEAMAALALFCRAAEEEIAEAGWTRHLVKYLYRAQHNPCLRFEPDSGESTGL